MNKKTKTEESEETTNSKPIEPVTKSTVKKATRVTKSSKPIKEVVDSSLNISKENIKKSQVR